jgi:hypothetical protein
MPPAAAPRPPAAPSPSTESLRFLQARVSGFALGSAAVMGLFVMFRAVMLFAFGGGGDHPTAFLLRGGALAVFLSGGLLLRGSPRPAGFVRAVEVATLLGASLLMVGLIHYLPLATRPELLVILGLTLAMTARAVSVPSSATRTLVLALLAGGPLLAATYVRYAAAASPPAPAGVAVAMAAAMWICCVVVLTATTRVIFRLRAEAGGKLGQYDLEEKLGEGGMGVVYRARHAMLRRPTAIKLLPPDRAGEGSVARFEREVQLTARLTHPNTVTVFDYGRTVDGVFYYAMELLEGVTLAELVERDGPQDPARVRHILMAVAGALAEAHGVGLIHRDIKPSNIMLCRRGGLPDVPKVLDFGLVRDLGAPAGSVTQADGITGTPHYISPEAIEAPALVDARADIYGLGGVGYFLLTGQHVYEGDNLVDLCSQHLHGRPVPPHQRLGRPLPPDLEALVLACLARQPGRRPATAAEVQARLAACAMVRPWTRADAERQWLRPARPRARVPANARPALLSELATRLAVARR